MKARLNFAADFLQKNNIKPKDYSTNEYIYRTRFWRCLKKLTGCILSGLKHSATPRVLNPMTLR